MTLLTWVYEIFLWGVQRVLDTGLELWSFWLSLVISVTPVNLQTWYVANLSSYVRTGAGLANVVVRVPWVISALGLYVTFLLSMVALRGILWLYHQFWGTN